MENIRRLILRGLSVGLLLALAACRATPPGRFETAVVTQVKRSITIGGGRLRDPLPETEGAIAKGLDLFSRHCIACH
ncbi:MAG: hypothetical protein DMF50_11625, partial [Acidobacteria bacterium]